MNYLRIYESLIERARTRDTIGYAESHHIIPKCIGGSDDSDNRVLLFPEEHFLAHLLLVKIYPSSNLILAVQKMCLPIKGGRPRRRMYGWLRRRFAARMSDLSSGSTNSQFGTIWINDGKENKKWNRTITLPDGYENGRLYLKPKKKSYCVSCGCEMGTKRKLCPDCLLTQQRSRIMPKGSESYEGRRFITNGLQDKLISISDEIPNGWRYGRSTNRPTNPGC